MTSLVGARCKMESTQVRPWRSWLVQIALTLALSAQVSSSLAARDDIVLAGGHAQSALRDADRPLPLAGSEQLSAPFDPSGLRNIHEAINSHPELRSVSLPVNLSTFVWSQLDQSVGCEPG